MEARKHVGEKVILPNGSVIVPVKSQENVNSEYFVRGKFVQICGKDKSKQVTDSVQGCST